MVAFHTETEKEKEKKNEWRTSNSKSFL